MKSGNADFPIKFIKRAVLLVWVALLLFPSAARAQFAAPKRVLYFTGTTKTTPGMKLTSTGPSRPLCDPPGPDALNTILNIWNPIGFQAKTNPSYFVITCGRSMPTAPSMWSLPIRMHRWISF